MAQLCDEECSCAKWERNYFNDSYCLQARSAVTERFAELIWGGTLQFGGYKPDTTHRGRVPAPPTNDHKRIEQAQGQRGVSLATSRAHRVETRSRLIAQATL